MACDKSSEEYTPEPNVYCLLRADHSITRVLCGMTLSYFDTIADPEKWNGVAGADVRISHAGMEFACAAIPDSAGFYATESLPVLARDTYALSIRYPTGEQVSGSTAVPDTFSITAVEIDTFREEYEPGIFYVQYDITPRWTRSEGADDYLAQSDAWYIGRHDSMLMREGPYVTYAGEAVFWLPQFLFKGDKTDDTLFLDRARLCIWAADRNYADYVKSRWQELTGSREPSHLDGGVGVFGAACIAETTLHFRAQNRDRTTKTPETGKSKGQRTKQSEIGKQETRTPTSRFPPCSCFVLCTCHLSARLVPGTCDLSTLSGGIRFLTQRPPAALTR